MNTNRSINLSIHSICCWIIPNSSTCTLAHWKVEFSIDRGCSDIVLTLNACCWRDDCCDSRVVWCRCGGCCCSCCCRGCCCMCCCCCMSCWCCMCCRYCNWYSSNMLLLIWCSILLFSICLLNSIYHLLSFCLPESILIVLPSRYYQRVYAHARVRLYIYICIFYFCVCVCVYVRGIFSLILASFCWWKMKNVLAYHLKETINPPKRRTFIYRFVSSYFGKTFFRKQFCLVCLFSLFFFSKLISKKNWFSSVDSLIASLRTLSMYFVFFFSKRCTRRARIAAADAIAAEQLLPLQLLMMLLRLLMNPF